MRALRYLFAGFVTLALVLSASGGPMFFGTNRASGPEPIPGNVAFWVQSGTSGSPMAITDVTANTRRTGGSATWEYISPRTEFHHTEFRDITPVTLPTPILVDGVVVTTISKALRLNLTLALSSPQDPLFEGSRLTQANGFSPGVTAFSAQLVFIPNTTAVGASNNTGFDLVGYEGGGFIIPQFSQGQFSGMNIRLHSSVDGAGSPVIPLVANHVYSASLVADATDGWAYLEVYDLTDGVTVGAARIECDDLELTLVNMQSYLLGAWSGGGTIDIVFWNLNENTTHFPMRRGYVVSPPTDVAISQPEANKLRVTFKSNSPQFEALREDNGGGYVSQGTFAVISVGGATTVNDTLTYNDATVVEGHTYSYRFIGISREHTSAYTQTDPLEVDNGPFAETALVASITNIGSTGGGGGTDIGFKFTVGGSGGTATKLSYYKHPTSYGPTRTLKLWNGSTQLGEATFDSSMVSAGWNDFPIYAPGGGGSPITVPLSASTAYYVTTDGLFDDMYLNATVTSTSFATVNDAVYDIRTVQGFGTGHMTGPMSIKYTSP